MRPDGYVRVSDVLKLRLFRGFALADVATVVSLDAKSRFELQTLSDGDGDNDDALYIRATQGHSIANVIDDSLLTPIDDASQYDVVLHGTYIRHWDSILRQGLSRMTRNHIHFTTGLPGLVDIRCCC